MLTNGRSSPLSIQEQYQDDDRWLRTRRRHHVLTGLCTILALMIAGAAWYAYPILKRHDSSLAQLVHTQQAFDKIDGSLQMERSNVAEWYKDQQQLRDQVTRLGREMGSRIETVRKETRQAGENLLYTVQAQIERQMEAMKSRVAALESSRDADKAQIAALQEQLGSDSPSRGARRSIADSVRLPRP